MMNQHTQLLDSTGTIKLRQLVRIQATTAIASRTVINVTTSSLLAMEVKTAFVTRTEKKPS